MGTSAPGTIVVTTVPAWEDTTDTMMKQIVVLLCLLPFSLCSAEAEASADAEADADPGYGRYYGHGGRYGYPYSHGRGHGHYGPKCHVTYEVVTSQECHAVPETVCHTEHVTNYVTETEQQCATHSVPECHTVVKQVPEQQCATHAQQECHQEEQCNTHYQTVVDTTYVEECQDIITHHCTETSATTQTHSAVVGHVVGGPVDVHAAGPLGVHAPGPLGVHAPGPHALPHAGAHQVGKRDAEADPEANAEADADAQLFNVAAPHGVHPGPVAIHQQPPQCQAHTERQCQKVPVETPRQVAVPHCAPVPVCVAVPRTQCTTVARPVSEQVCHDRPVTECVQVPRQVPVQVPVEKCGQVPREVCTPVHQKVPRKHCTPGYAHHGHAGHH